MNIFLVEDSMIIRTLLLRSIEAMRCAYVVGEAECEETAIALIEGMQPDLVLLDIQLAFGGSGLTVLQRLRRGRFAGHIFVMSQQSHPAYRDAAYRLGGNKFYDKGIEMEEMLFHVSTLAAANCDEPYETPP